MLTREQVSCVIARVGEAGPGRLAIADLIADHRPGPAAQRAETVFARLPGCEIFLALSGRGVYLAFTRGGGRFEIARAEGGGGVPAAAAEACARALYARACTGHWASLARTSSA